MLKLFAAVTVAGTVLLSQCTLNEPERAAFSDGMWREISKPELGVNTYFITVARDSFYLKERLWTDIPQCNGTVCTGTHLNTFAKGTLAAPGDQMVTFTGIITDSLFSALADSTGNQIPYDQLYFYSWTGDTLVLVKDNESYHEQRKMIKEK